jgi:hypothetical protein
MKITYQLDAELSKELEMFVAECSDVEDPITPNVFAKQCLENELAERRLSRMQAEKADFYA